MTEPVQPKAYDVKVLVERLKADGLDLAEDAATKVFENVLAWVQESAALSPNPYDDLIAVVVPQVRKLVLEQIDKIDGEVDRV